MSGMQEVVLQIPTTEFSNVIMTKIKANVSTESLELQPDPEEEGCTLTLEERLVKYVRKSEHLQEKIEQIRESAKAFLPETLSVADFVSISMAHSLIASEFLQVEPVPGEILHVAVWDSVTKVEAPIVRKIVKAPDDNDFPSEVQTSDTP